MKKLLLQWMVILAVLFAAQANAAVVKMLLMGDTQYILNTSSVGDWKLFTNAMYKVTRDTVTSNAMFLASMGDICEDTDRGNNVPLSYDHAVIGFNLLNGRMPYILNFGNNDTASEYKRVFPLANFSGKPEFVANNDAYVNHAEKFSAGGVDWLVISIKRFPDAALVSWAEGLINANPSKKVIIVNHTEELGDGNVVWTMAKKKSNVVFLFLGHNLVMHELKTADDGHKVGRIQTCWHNKDNDHYLCKVEADTVAGTVNCSYYSPVNKNYKDVNNSTYKWSWSGFNFGGSAQTTVVPWVTNLTVAAAGTSITNAGLVVSSVSQEHHATVPAGKIFSQTPGGGTTVNRGSSVALAESLGPASGTTVTFVSVAAHDGYVDEASETSNTGGVINATSTDGNAIRVGDTGARKQRKGFVSFDCSSLPDTCTIISATLKLKRGGGIGTPTSLSNLVADVKNVNGGWSDNAALQSADFQGPASASGVATLSYPAATNSWAIGALNATGLTKINKTTASHTQYRIRFTLDDDNDSADDYLGFYSGENATAANRPILEVTYQ